MTQVTEAVPVDPTAVIRVLLCDDNLRVGSSLNLLVTEFSGLEVVGEASDAREALDQIGQQRPDVVVMNIAALGIDGLEAIRSIVKNLPQVRVVVLSTHSDENHVLQALRAGASAYVLMAAAPRELELAIQSVARGGIFLSSAIATHVTDGYLNHIRDQGGRQTAPVSAARRLAAWCWHLLVGPPSVRWTENDGGDAISGVFVNLARAVKAGWKLCLLTTLLGVAAGIYYLVVTPVYYDAVAKLGPSSSSPGAAGSGQALAQLAAVGSLFGVNTGNAPVDPYGKFREVLNSVELAREMGKDDGVLEQLFPKARDPDTHAWIRPSGAIMDLRVRFFRLIGRSPWVPPDDTEISRRLEGHLQRLASTTNVMTVSFSANSAGEAKRILTLALSDADDIVRSQYRTQAEKYAAYIQGRMSSITESDQRVTLTTLLSEYQKTIILANADVPFGAALIDPPSVSNRPSGPNIRIVLGAGMAAGFLLGFLVCVVYLRRTRRSPSFK